MEQLLQIKTIPVNYELTVHNARLEIKAERLSWKSAVIKAACILKAVP